MLEDCRGWNSSLYSLSSWGLHSSQSHLQCSKFLVLLIFGLLKVKVKVNQRSFMLVCPSLFLLRVMNDFNFPTFGVGFHALQVLVCLWFCASEVQKSFSWLKTMLWGSCYLTLWPTCLPPICNTSHTGFYVWNLNRQWAVKRASVAYGVFPVQKGDVNRLGPPPHPHPRLSLTINDNALAEIDDMRIQFWIVQLRKRSWRETNRILSNLSRRENMIKLFWLDREHQGDCLQQMVISSTILGVPESQSFTEGKGCCVRFQRRPGSVSLTSQKHQTGLSAWTYLSLFF